jgi:hypothetical protein
MDRSRHHSNLPYRQPSRQQSRQMSVDPHNEVHVIQNHYIGIDVGTGSARACIMNEKGDIVGLASENIGLWQPQPGYYVCKIVIMDPRERSTDFLIRNNRLPTSGGVSAVPSSVPCNNIISTRTPFVVLALTPLALSRFSGRTQTSP